MRGLLGADLIGLHTYDYAQDLTFSLRRLLGLEAREGVLKLEGRSVRIEAHPLGIDAKGMLAAAFSKRADRKLKALKKVMGGRKVMLGVDRLDYTKGLTLKLAAFRHLLSTSPKWRDKVVLIQIAVPSRSGIDAYRKQKDEVERQVGEINGMYGAPEGLLPVRYFYRSVPPEELGALYRLADVALVTPVRDGLNLVAKEYVACHEGDSALVLSEFAGAASELGEAFRVNPWDVEGTAAAIERVLEMDPGERQDRVAAMRRRVLSNDVHHWAQKFMKSLTAPGSPEPATPPMLPPEVLAETIGPEFALARNSLIVLDYDGTLREFTHRYEDAAPSKKIL
ncbi:MAG: trehalose-6-phosphate synthase, partial [Chloroflexi bacterium]|nr:trehalose-6-phosphate synthase [Chloroflexota bacterium]